MARPQIEIVINDPQQFHIGLLRGAVTVNVDRQRMRDADSVGDLDEHPPTEPRLHQRQCHPSRSVSGTAVDLGEVLAGESAPAVGPPAAIRIDDDLAACQAGIALRTADNESAARIQVVDRVLVEIMVGNDFVDDFREQCVLELFLGDGLVVLGRYDDRVDPLRHAGAVLRYVLHGDLATTITAILWAATRRWAFNRPVSSCRAAATAECHSADIRPIVC